MLINSFSISQMREGVWLSALRWSVFRVHLSKWQCHLGLTEAQSRVTGTYLLMILPKLLLFSLRLVTLSKNDTQTMDHWNGAGVPGSQEGYPILQNPDFSLPIIVHSGLWGQCSLNLLCPAKLPGYCLQATARTHCKNSMPHCLFSKLCLSLKLLLKRALIIIIITFLTTLAFWVLVFCQLQLQVTPFLLQNRKTVM